MIYQSVIIASLFAVASAGRVFSSNEKLQKYLWESFKLEYRKNYADSNEETRRFHYFLENLKNIDLRNEAELQKGGSAVHGITKFSDMSQSEFESVFLKADPTKKTNSAQVVDIRLNTTASLVDWEGVYTTPVKDQGYCGSCWAFSATEQIESDAIRTLGVEYLLSPEQIVQCDKTSLGCRGGWTESAYTYVKKNGGLETEDDYPYTSYLGRTGTCNSDSSLLKITVSDYYTLTSESAMAAYVQSTGPLSVCVDASTWNSYKSGILSVCGTSVDHCVQATGVYPDTSSGYWRVRNSWGTSWGESGFIRLAYGANTCAITNDPTYATVAKA